MRFADRRDAGERLAGVVASLGPQDPVVYALPNGGVPVAAPIADLLGADLDIVLVRKIGVPGHRELAMGAVGETGEVVRNRDLIARLGITEADFERATDLSRQELARRAGVYRERTVPVSPRGRLAIVVDDGLATGATARAAVQVLREMGANGIWLAVPVAPPDAAGLFDDITERFIVLTTPHDLGAVGRWYDSFDHVEDEEVLDLLDR